MRADRLLSIVLLLQRHRHLTAKALAESLDVTERTIYRDIEALSIAGVPVYTRSGTDGGCFLDEQYRTSLNWLSGIELQTLMSGDNRTALSDLGMQHIRDNAVLKLLSLIPQRHQTEANLMRQRLYVDSSGWYGLTEPHPALPQLKEAVWGDFWVTASYESWEGDSQIRTFAPYSLIYKSERWYLAAKANPDGLMRTYRVSRLSDVQVLDQRFERDSDFDIATYWAAASAQFLQRLPIYPVILRAQPDAMLYFRNTMTGRFEVLEQNETILLLRVQYMVFEEARTSILGLGVLVEVIDPPTLHTAVLEQARALVAKYT